MATLGSLKSKVLKCKVSLNDPVRNATYNTFHKVTLDTTLEKLDRILDKEHFALVVHSQRLCKKTSNYIEPNYSKHPKAEPSVWETEHFCVLLSIILISDIRVVRFV